MNLTFQTSNAGISFFSDNRLIGIAKSAPNTKDRFILLNEHSVRWERELLVPAEDMEMSFACDYKHSWQMYPRLMYGENLDPAIIDRNMIIAIARNHDPSKVEKGYYYGITDDKTGEPWRIPWWELSIPGAAYSESAEGICVGVFLPPDQMDGSVRMEYENNKTCHVLSWPEEAAPRTGRERPNGTLFAPFQTSNDETRSTWEEGYRCEMPERSCFAVVLVFDETDRPRTGWHRLIDESWRIYNKYVPPKFNQDELWEIGISYAKSLYQITDGKGVFSFGKVWNGENWDNWFNNELGWCGQSASIAVSLLTEALRTGDEDAKNKAIECLDNWVEHTTAAGLLPTHFPDQEFNWFGKRVTDSCNLYYGVSQFFEAWKLCHMLGIERESYYNAACRICDFAVEKMDAETGRIGKSWLEEDLTPVVSEGTTGSFLTWALCEGYRYTGRKAYLDAAVRSFDYYYGDFMEKGYTIGGAIDIFTIDKESGIPLLTAALQLADLTGNTNYVNCAVDAAYYLSTWQWCYTRKFRKGSPLDLLGYNSFGGTGISIQDAANDPYALLYVNELYDLAERTGNRMWAERAYAAWVNGMDGISDGNMICDGRPIPLGGQHEARSLGREHHGIYQWLVAWPTAFRLYNIRRTFPVIGDRTGRKLQ